MLTFKNNDRVDFIYTSTKGESFIVVGTVIDRSKNVKEETPVITVQLDTPRVGSNGKPQAVISCKLDRINMPNWNVVEV